MVGWEQKKTGDLLLLLNGLMLALVINQLAALYFFRLDLTEEQRHSIKPPTIELLRGLEDDIYVDVFLAGDLNAEFHRLQKAVRETLSEFRVYSNYKVHYRFSDPAAAAGEKAQREYMTDLISRGIQPLNIIETRDGQRTEKIVFPGALISYGGLQEGVILLKDQVTQRSQEDLNRAVEGLEFELANTIQKLITVDKKKIGFAFGHGELDSLQLTSLYKSLLPLYEVNFRADLLTKKKVAAYALLIIAKPQNRFSEREKYVLDQYLLGGGSVLLLIDPLRADMDSASMDNYFSFPYRLGLDDQLFKYGVRINQDLVQDRVSLRYPVVTGTLNGQPQMTPLEWPFFPLVNHYAEHPVTRNLDAAALRFASSMDSVKAVGIRKIPLLFTSVYSRRLSAPVKVNANDLRKEIKRENFSSGPMPLGYLLEGKFESLYKNRFIPDGIDSSGNRTEGLPAKLIVVADGDVARNEINRRNGKPMDLGYDPMTGHTYANKDLLMNMISYLTDENGLINVRSKEITVRPLSREKVRDSRLTWQFVNLGIPLILVVLFGTVKAYIRRRRFGRHSTT